MTNNDGFVPTPELIESYKRRNRPTSIPAKSKPRAFAVPRPTVWGWLAMGLVLAAVLAACQAAMPHNQRRSEVSSFPSSGILKRIERLERNERNNAKTLIRIWKDHTNRLSELEKTVPKPILPDPRFQ